MSHPFKFFLPLVVQGYRWRTAADKKRAVGKKQDFSEKYTLLICRVSDGSFKSLSIEDLQAARQFIEDYFKEKDVAVHDLRLEYTGVLNGYDIWKATFTVS